MFSYDISPASGFPNMYDTLNDKITNGGTNITILVILTGVIILYFIIFKYLGTKGTTISSIGSEQSNGGMRMIEMLMWGTLVFLVLINGLQYFFSIDVKTTIKKMFTSVPEVDITLTDNDNNNNNNNNDDTSGVPIPEIMIEKQVFHIPEQKYSYYDAEAVCAAYDARLATLDEINDAYDDGGEWCSYGWSQDKLVLYPTQPDTYKKLKKIRGHRHDCGRSGINGGFIKNPNARFGVNCYGHKPKASQKELDYMEDTTVFPLNERDRKFERRVDHYRRKLKEILVAPFNRSDWSEI